MKEEEKEGEEVVAEKKNRQTKKWNCDAPHGLPIPEHKLKVLIAHVPIDRRLPKVNAPNPSMSSSNILC